MNVISSVNVARLTQTAGYQIYSVVVRKIHGRPPQPHGVEAIDGEKLGEQMAHEQRLQSCPARVEGGECAENQG